MRLGLIWDISWPLLGERTKERHRTGIVKRRNQRIITPWKIVGRKRR